MSNSINYIEYLRKVEFKIKVYSSNNKFCILKCCCFNNNADKILSLQCDEIIKLNGFLKSHKRFSQCTTSQEIFIINFECLEKSNYC